MMIEVKGIGLPNRGAELMLLAVQEQFEKRGVAAHFVVEPLGDYETRVKYKLFQKSRFFGKGINFGWPFSLLPKVIRDKYGIVNKSEIDFVIDASGFAYGDKWGPKLIRDRLIKELEYFRSRGIKIVLLPQAFGPFKEPSVAEMSKTIFSASELVIARDQVSYDFVKTLSGCDNVRLYPDFTNLVQPIEVPVYKQLIGRPCIIPNFQMLKRGGQNENYLKTLAAAYQHLQKRGENPFVLIHEGVRDYQLARKVAQLVDNDVEIIDPRDALIIKSIISKSSLVVGSRFHGLVSALSTGVPVVAMGWSHKYEMLLKDYNVPELLVKVDEESVVRLIEQIFDKDFKESVLLRVNEQSKTQKVHSKQMWDEVFGVLGL